MAVVKCHQITAENVFHIIGIKMRSKLEEEKGIILFEFFGVICDYNDIDIK